MLQFLDTSNMPVTIRLALRQAAVSTVWSKPSAGCQAIASTLR